MKLLNGLGGIGTRDRGLKKFAILPHKIILECQIIAFRATARKIISSLRAPKTSVTSLRALLVFFLHPLEGMD